MNQSQKISPSHRIFQHSAFTLVELIVVITVLSILATIGFISYQGYTEGARDSARMADITNIYQTLEAYASKGSQIPTPTNSITLTASGASNIVGYQGKAGSSILSILGMGDAKDPKTGEYYTYTTNTQGNTQVVALLEASPTNSVFSKGSSLGVLFATGTTSGSNNTMIPLDSVVNNNSGVLDIVLTSTGYTAVFGSDTTNRITGTGVNLITAFSSLSPDGKSLASYDPNLVGYWDMQTLVNSGGIMMLKDFSKYGNDGVFFGNLAIDKINRGVKFNGIAWEFISIPHITWYNFTHSDAFSVFVESKSPTNQNEISGTWHYNCLLEKWSAWTGYPFTIRIKNQLDTTFAWKFINARYDSINNPYVTSNSIIADNQIHKLIFKRDYNNIIANYIDWNIETSTLDTTSGDTTNSYNLIVWACQDGYKSPYTWIIYNIRIYSRTLSDSEIKMLK